MTLSWEALKHPVRMQVKRLAHQADRGLVRFCGALLSLDVFFIVVFAGHRAYTALYHETPLLGDGWDIARDASYAEMFGYLKTGVIVSALVSIRGKRHRPIYLALILIFTVALLDDALQLHERVGHGLVANALGLQSWAGRMSPHVGELIVWATFAVCLLAAARAGFVRSPQEDRSNGLLLMGGFAVLVLFAVVVDLAHVVTKYYFRFRGADFLFTVTEEGGEQIALSLACGLALLIRREVRSRDRSVTS